MKKTLGQIGYEKYLASGPNPGRTYNDLPMPTWDELAKTEEGLITRSRWEESGAAVAAYLVFSGEYKAVRPEQESEPVPLSEP